MRIRAVAGSFAAAFVALLLVGGLGSDPAQDAAADSSRGLWPLAASLTDFPRWTGGEAHGLEPGLDLAVAAKVAVLAVVVFVLAQVAGRSGSVVAALLAGWGGFVVACGAAGAAYYLVAEARDVEMASIVGEMNAGASFGLYTGLLVGAAVVLARPRERIRRPRVRPAGSAAAAVTGLTGPVEVPPIPRSSGVELPTPTRAPSPQWVPPRSLSPLPAVPLPRRGGAYSDEERDRFLAQHPPGRR